MLARTTKRQWHPAIHAEDFGPYTVNADCTGTIFILGGTGSIEIVLVDGGERVLRSRHEPFFHSCHVQCGQEAVSRRGG